MFSTLPFAAAVLLAGTRALQPPPGPADAVVRPYEGERIVRVPGTTARQFLGITSMEIDVLTHSPAVGGPLDLRVSPAQVAALRELGLDPAVVVEDLQARVDDERARIAALAANDGVAFYQSYRNIDELRTRVQQLAQANPALGSAFVAGLSLEGRAIDGVRITAPDRLGNPRDRRPGVLFNATQHAREWVAPMAAVYFAENLIARRATDPLVRDLVNRLEFIVVPVSNPDGYAHTWAGARFWRKNMYREGGTLYGVDLNRNWGFEWGGAGAGSSPTSETYRGPGPFSEPETRVLRDLILANPRIIAHNDIHTYGNLILSPWCYVATPPPDAAFYNTANSAIAAAMLAVNGATYRPGQWHSTLYPSSGTAVDYAYGGRRVWSWTFELRGGRFDPPANQILPACTETFAGLLEIARRVARPVCTADANLDGTVDFNDLLEFLNLSNASDPLADLNEDGVIDFNDLLEYLNVYNAGC
jgi:hypothetical protein